MGVVWHDGQRRRCSSISALAVQPDKAPLTAIIGVAWILGAATLFWLSSPATLSLVRDNENRVTATIEARLFGLIVHDTAKVERVRSLGIQRFEHSDTPPRLIFETNGGSVDLGRNQQLFMPDLSAIDAFVKADGPAALTLSSIARGSEQRRFVIAQIVALGLFLGGAGLCWLAVRSLYA